MNPLLLTIGRFFRDFCVAIMLWAYAGLVIFTWHIARSTPEWAVLLRVAASVINDLVWVPLGILAWSYAVLFLKRILRPGGEESLLLKPVVAILVILFHILFTDTAFKFLFIPLAISAIACLKRILDGRTGFHLLGWYFPIIIVTALTIVHYHHQMLPGRPGVPVNKTIKVLSYNIYYDGKHEDRMKVIDTIKKENADIFCCIEFNFQKDGPLFGREIGELYPYTLTSDHSRYSKSGSIIFSKYPIRYYNLRNQRKMQHKWSSKVSIIFAELDVDGRKVNLVNYHLKSVGHYIEYVADKDFAVKDKIEWAAKNEEKNDREKAIQAQSLVDLMADSTNPTILCGDLNDTPNSRVFQVLQKSYKNTFSNRGWGLGNTFGEARIQDNLSWIPFISYAARDLVRIDHIFVSKDIRIHSARVLSDAHGSDHKPVVSVIELE